MKKNDDFVKLLRGGWWSVSLQFPPGRRGGLCSPPIVVKIAGLLNYGDDTSGKRPYIRTIRPICR